MQYTFHAHMHAHMPRPPAPLQQGFTMVELLTVVSVLGVLLAVAAPSFAPLIERWRVRQAAEAVQSSLHYARSEALRRGGNVVLAPVACGGASDCGWELFHDADGNGRKDAQDEVLRVIPATRGVDIRVQPATGVPFNRWGLPDSAAGAEFALMPASGNAKNSSLVCLKSGGLVRRLNQFGSTSPISCS